MRQLKPILLGMLLVVMLAACGGNTGGTTSSTTPTPKAAVTPPAVTPVPQKPGTTKVTFWYGLSGHNGEVVQTLINKYNQSQNKYYVVGEFQSSYDDTLSKFNASVSGKDLPNIVQIYDIGTQRMIDTKKIVPVQDLVNRDGLQSLIDDLEPAIRSYYTIGGKLYSMPFNSSTAVMYYDKNAFKAAGLPIDKKTWSYDELLDAVKKLTKKDASGKVTYAGATFFDYSWLLEQEIAIHNGLFSSPENGRTTQRANKYVFNNDAAVKWLELQKQMIDAGAAYFPANGDASNTTKFLNGEAALTFQSIASLRAYVDTAHKNGDKVDVGVAYMPRRSNDGRNIIGGASLWVTNTGTNEQQAGAWDFIKYSAQVDSQVFFASNTGYVPVRKSAYDTPEMKDTLSKYPQFMSAVEQIRAAPTNNFNAGSVTGTMLPTRNLIQTSIDDYLNGRTASAQAALDSAAKKANDQLEEYNASLK